MKLAIIIICFLAATILLLVILPGTHQQCVPDAAEPWLRCADVTPPRPAFPADAPRGS